MNIAFKDILNLTKKKPKWYDYRGVPRFCKFTPDSFSNLYANTVALIEVACQNCGKKYKVAVGYSAHESSLSNRALINALGQLPRNQNPYFDDAVLFRLAPSFKLSKANAALKNKFNKLLNKHFHLKYPSKTKANDFHYGDPPACCGTGDCMNVENIRVLEFWERKNTRLSAGWKRNKKYEIVFKEGGYA